MINQLGEKVNRLTRSKSICIPTQMMARGNQMNNSKVCGVFNWVCGVNEKKPSVLLHSE